MATPMHALHERLEPSVVALPGATRKTIFGHPGFAVRGKVFGFCDDGEVVVKAPAAEFERLLTWPGAYAWVPPGSGMTRWGTWVGLPEGGVADDGWLEALELAYEALAAATP